MYVARILYPVHVLGPGERIGIWFCGCEHHCKGCSNPELWEQQERYRTSADTVMGLIHQICRTHAVDGFTLTGGDPFYQPEALAKLLPALSAISDDILVYTGYDYSDVKWKYPKLMAQIGVLVDGKYLEQRNTGVVIRGSDNQNILILQEHLVDRYQSYLESAVNEIENFTTVDGIISVGIHRPGYDARMDALLRQKGLESR